MSRRCTTFRQHLMESILIEVRHFSNISANGKNRKYDTLVALVHNRGQKRCATFRQHFYFATYLFTLSRIIHDLCSHTIQHLTDRQKLLKLQLIKTEGQGRRVGEEGRKKQILRRVKQGSRLEKQEREMVDQNTMKIMYVFFKILPKCRTLRETKLQKMLPFCRSCC